ncbi:MAG: stage II sporulation protein M [Lachnospira sp.]
MYLKNILIRYRFLLLILAGVVFGTCYANLMYKYGTYNKNIFTDDFLSVYDEVTINSLILWGYVCKNRLKDFLLMIILGLTGLCKPVFIAVFVMLGICSGTLLSFDVMRYGFTGILIYVVSIFPQYIFYMTALYIMVKAMYKKNFHRTKMWLLIVLAFIIVIIGTYFESYVNPVILKNIYYLIY